MESANLAGALPRLAGPHKELGRQGAARAARSPISGCRGNPDRAGPPPHRTPHRRSPWRTGGRGAGADDAAENAAMPRVFRWWRWSATRTPGNPRFSTGCWMRTAQRKTKRCLSRTCSLPRTRRSAKIRPDWRAAPVSAVGYGRVYQQPADYAGQGFRSTLDEVKYADILCIVSDVSDPEYREDLKITVDTLEGNRRGRDSADLCVQQGRRRGTFFPRRLVRCERAGYHGQDGRFTMSAKNPDDISRFVDLIENKVNAGRTECTLLILIRKGTF